MLIKKVGNCEIWRYDEGYPYKFFVWCPDIGHIQKPSLKDAEDFCNTHIKQLWENLINGNIPNEAGLRKLEIAS